MRNNVYMIRNCSLHNKKLLVKHCHDLLLVKTARMPSSPLAAMPTPIMLNENNYYSFPL